MGNICTKQDVKPVEEDEKDEWEPIGNRRPTKGEGLLGKTEWTDDEDEDEEEEGCDGEPAEIIGELPQIRYSKGADDQLPARSSRVTLINRPQCISVVNDAVEKNITITFIGQVPNNSEETSKRINEEIQRMSDSDKTIQLYSGDLTENLKHIKIDAAVTKQSGSSENTSSDYVHLTKGGCQLMCSRLEERIGILGLTDADDEGKWLEYTKSEAKKMRDSDKPSMIIALTTCDIVKAKKLATICVEGVKAILCQDESAPSGEEVVLGTPIINLNPTENKICTIEAAIDQLHEVDCKPAKFITY